MKCEYCDREATHVDGSAVDLENSGLHHATAYRDRPLCDMHAREAATVNTSRVRPIPVDHAQANSDERVSADQASRFL